MEKRSVTAIRDLAAKVAELAQSPGNKATRALWTAHNRLTKVRPPVYVRINCWPELIPEHQMSFKDGVLRDVEFYLRTTLYNATLGFDLVVDPFITVPAVYAGPASERLWGLDINHKHPAEAKGAWGFDPPLRDYADLDQLQKPGYRIDDGETQRQVQIVREALDDLLDVRVDYAGPLGISACLGYAAASLRGFQQLMTDVVDNPDGVHRLMRFLMEGHLEYLHEMERQNRIVPNHVRWPFYHEPMYPDYDSRHVCLKDCWGWGESQEFDLFSPAMFDEFLLTYQTPIFELTGLNNYGCCENLTHKYGLLKKVPGLRRVSVSPWTDFAVAMEIMGGRCALNWRYPPAEVIFNFDEDKIRSTLKNNFTLARKAPVEVVLQDIETVAGHPERLRRWVEIAREVAEQNE